MTASRAACSAERLPALTPIVAAGGGFGAEDALAPFHRVEIDLQDAPLVPEQFQPDGDDRFLGLAPGRLGGREKEVLRQLLGDGRAAGHHLALPLVLFQGLLHAFPVEAFVVDELVVLGRDHGALELIRYPLVRHPGMLQFGLGILSRSSSSRWLMKAGGARINVLPPDYPAEVPALPKDDQRDQAQQQAAEPRRCRPHGRRSVSRTAPVRGRMPRQTKKASAACSTSMPRPSAPVAPAARAWRQEGRLPAIDHVVGEAVGSEETGRQWQFGIGQTGRSGVDDQVERTRPASGIESAAGRCRGNPWPGARPCRRCGWR